MKKLILAPLGIMLTLAGVIASKAEKILLTDFHQSKPVEIKRPLFGDTTAQKKFIPADLLKYKWNGDFTTVAQGTSAHDTTGFLRLPSPVSGLSINGLRTHIKAERFTRGNLKVTSNLPFEVFADGVSLGKKETAEDSIAPESIKNFNLELAPEYVTEIIVKLINESKGKSVPRVSVEYVPDEKFKDVLISTGAEMMPRFSIKTTVDGPRVTSSSLSPDGKYLIINYQQTFSSQNIRKWAVLSETATGRIINADFPSRSEWVSKGNSVISVVPNENAFDIYCTEIPSMKQTLLASKVPTQDFELAPDASYLIYSEYKEGKKEKGPMKQITSPDDRIPGNRGRSYLIKYDIANGISQPLTMGGSSTNLCDISADSKKILFLTSKETPSIYPFYANSLVQMDVNTLETDTIVNGDGYITGGIYSPDARQVFVWGGPSSFNNIGANQGEHPMPNDFDTQGYILDIKDGKVKAVTRNFNPAITGTPVWNSADGKIYFRAIDGFYQPIYSYNPANGTFTKLNTDIDKVFSFSIGSHEAKWLTYTGQSYNKAGGLYRLDLYSGKSTPIDEPLKTDLEKLNIGEVINASFTTSDGSMIDGNIILPPDFDSSRKYPMIVYYYGGTLPSDRSMNSPYTPHLFASRDYVVYVVNPSGAVGYGQEFSARHVNAWGKRTAEDIIEGVKKMCSQHPYIDEKKIGCIGASYGGFMTQYLLTQTDLFAAAVSHAGISNVTSYWGEGYWGYTYNSVAAAKSYPWTDPDLFTKQGSLFNADKIHTPLLLLHGTVDTNVPIGESIQLFNALKILNRDVEFITVEDQDHIIMDYEKRVLWHATIMAWFAKWLQGDPRWWDSLYGAD